MCVAVDVDSRLSGSRIEKAAFVRRSMREEHVFPNPFKMNLLEEPALRQKFHVVMVSDYKTFGAIELRDIRLEPLFVTEENVAKVPRLIALLNPLIVPIKNAFIHFIDVREWPNFLPPHCP